MGNERRWTRCEFGSELAAACAAAVKEAARIRALRVILLQSYTR